MWPFQLLSPHVLSSLCLHSFVSPGLPPSNPSLSQPITSLNSLPFNLETSCLPRNIISPLPPSQTILLHLLPNPDLSIPFLDLLLIAAVAGSMHTSRVSPKATDPGFWVPSASSPRPRSPGHKRLLPQTQDRSPSEPLEGRLEGWDRVRGRPKGVLSPAQAPCLEYPNTHTHRILTPLNQKPHRWEAGIWAEDRQYSGP